MRVAIARGSETVLAMAESPIDESKEECPHTHCTSVAFPPLQVLPTSPGRKKQVYSSFSPLPQKKRWVVCECVHGKSTILLSVSSHAGSDVLLLALELGNERVVHHDHVQLILPIPKCVCVCVCVLISLLPPSSASVLPHQPLRHRERVGAKVTVRMTVR